MQDARGADPEDDDRAPGERELDAAVHPRLEAHGPRALLEATAVQLLEALVLPAGGAVQLHDVDRGERLVHGGRDLTLPLALLLGVDADPAPVEHGQQEDQRHHPERDQRQQRIDDEHHREHQAEQNHTCAEVDGRVDQDVAQQHDVGAEAHQQITGRAPLVERERQPVQVAVEAATDRVDDLLGRAREEVVLVVVGDPAHEAGGRKPEACGGEQVVMRVAEDREGPRPKAARRLPEQHLVEDDLERPGLGHAGQRVHEPERAAGDELAAALAHVLAEIPVDHADRRPAWPRRRRGGGDRGHATSSAGRSRSARSARSAFWLHERDPRT